MRLSNIYPIISTMFEDNNLLNTVRPKKMTQVNTVQLIEEIYCARHTREKKNPNKFLNDSNDLI